MNTSKGTKGFSALKLSTTPGAIDELEDTWILDPDHIFLEFWPEFLKSTT